MTNPGRGRVVIYNGIMWIDGQTASDKSVSVEGQTRQALDRLDGVLCEAETDRARLLFAQIWRKGIARNFAGINAAWDAWVDPAHAPARATAQCAMAMPDTLIENVVTAAV